MDSTTDFIHDSIADVPEDQLVDRIVTDPLWQYDFFDFAGIPRGMTNRQNVLLNTAPGKVEGDIDVLRCDPDHPEYSVACQFKRIKFGLNHVRKGKPSKLHEYEKLARQANLLARMGFWQVFAYVVVVADTRERNCGKVTYDGLPTELKSQADLAISSDILDPRVGLVVVDFTQPMDRAPFTVGTHGLHLRRLATPVEQGLDLTRWVSEQFFESEHS